MATIYVHEPPGWPAACANPLATDFEACRAGNPRAFVATRVAGFAACRSPFPICQLFFGMRVPTSRAWLLAAGIAVGCLTDEGSLVAPTVFTKVTGTDAQIGVAGGRLAAPFEVSVLSEDGSGVVRIEVAWSVVAGPGGGTLSDSITITDGRGRAQVWLTAGATPGAYTVQASLSGNRLPAVVFTATTGPAPAVTAVTPPTFGGGDVVTVTGTDFTAATAFSIGGAEARFAATTTPTTAQLVAPQCLPAGPVPIEAVLRDVRSAPLTATYTSATTPITLAVGEFVSIAAPDVQGCATVPSAGPAGAEYTVVPQSVSDEPSVEAGYRLRSGSGAPVVVRAPTPHRPPTFAERFHAEIREMERELSSQRVSATWSTEALGAAPGATIRVGEIREFTACSVFPCRTTADFETVQAEARFVGEHSAIFQDVDAPADGFPEADFEALGQVFDDVLYDVGTEAFGAESDLDNNGLVIILLTPAVNRLTASEQCSTSFVTGFFLPIDVDPAFQRDPRSNRGEIFYAFVPDPGGSVTCQHSVQRVRNAVPVTFVHEFQHMISYYQHVIVRDGGVEDLWVNEGLSHLAEELAGHAFRAAGDDASFSRYVVGNLANVYRYLLDPGATFLLSDDGGGTLEERGAAWLFFRWLVDVHGDAITRRLVETDATGAANVEAAAGRTMREMLPEWMLATWVSDLLPESVLAPRLRYQTWEFRTTFDALNQQAPQTFSVPFPIVPTRLNAPFDVLGSLRSGSGDYFTIDQAGGGPAVSIEFVGINGQPLGSETAPRLNILRVR